MKKICITGANGFIGKTVYKSLKAQDYHIRGFVRDNYLDYNSLDNKHISVGDISSKTNWKRHLEGFECIIHCAGLTDQMSGIKDINFYKKVNIDGTRRLAKQAVEAGVRRLVFLSTIKVNGESSDKNDEKKNFFK